VRLYWTAGIRATRWMRNVIREVEDTATLCPSVAMERLTKDDDYCAEVFMHLIRRKLKAERLANIAFRLGKTIVRSGMTFVEREKTSGMTAATDYEALPD
jgi:phosphosulfolactate phosphohydrolase-like enzyme